MKVWQSLALLFVALNCVGMLVAAVGGAWWWSSILCFVLAVAWPSMVKRNG